MSLLLVHSALGVHHIEVMEGQSVREALDASTLRVRAACGGTGACGACLVRVIEGEVSTPTVVE
ncbi:MAG: 2Fe-2S iron-sulfur cluster-binding protein, partial [Candidatus Competibacter sp.]